MSGGSSVSEKEWNCKNRDEEDAQEEIEHMIWNAEHNNRELKKIRMRARVDAEHTCWTDRGRVELQNYVQKIIFIEQRKIGKTWFIYKVECLFSHLYSREVGRCSGGLLSSEVQVGAWTQEVVASIWLQPEKPGWQGGARENKCSLLYRLEPM